MFNKAELARRYNCDPRTIDRYLKIQSGEIVPTTSSRIEIPKETIEMIIDNYWKASVYKSIYLFANKDGNQISPQQYEKEFKCMMAILGIRHVVNDTKKTYIKQIEFSVMHCN